jgi:hypothetical protein
MKYVVIKNAETDKVRKLGRFSENAVTERYSLQGFWVEDNTLESDLFDGLLEEISEAEAKRIIATQFSQTEQAA